MNAEFRAKARQTLQGKWQKIMVIAIIASILTTGLPVFIFKWLLGAEIVAYIATVIENPEMFSMLPGAFHDAINRALIVFVVLKLLLNPVLTTFSWIMLDLTRNQAVDKNQLFGHLSPNYGKLIIYHFLYNLFVKLWSLLFIIPGIIKALSYSLSPYLLKDNPGMTGNEAITKSRELMNGRKMNLFLLYLSFIGWYLLALLAISVLDNLVFLITEGSFILQNIMLFIVQSVVISAVYVYVEVSIAHFYENVIAEQNSNAGSSVNLEKPSTPQSKIIV